MTGRPVAEMMAEIDAAELARWRALQPGLDRLSALLGVCEGVSPIEAAVSEIQRLRVREREATRREPPR